MIMASRKPTNIVVACAPMFPMTPERGLQGNVTPYSLRGHGENVTMAKALVGTSANSMPAAQRRKRIESSYYSRDCDLSPLRSGQELPVQSASFRNLHAHLI